MSISLAPARPPFIEFKRVATHDKQASVAAGYRKTKDVDMAYIMQAGSKDVFEKEAEAWLESIKRKGLEGAADAFPQEWIDSFHKKFEAWKAGQEPPLDGTSVKEWALLSPSQAENFITLRMLTIEDVAAMNEEAMNRYGMGGRELRDKARDWLKGREVAESVSKENEELKAQLATMQAQLAELLEKSADDKPKRGRPFKEAA